MSTTMPVAARVRENRRVRKTVRRRSSGSASLAGAAYAVWRALAAVATRDRRSRWQPQPFPFPPQPAATPSDADRRRPWVDAADDGRVPGVTTR